MEKLKIKKLKCKKNNTGLYNMRSTNINFAQINKGYDKHWLVTSSFFDTNKQRHKKGFKSLKKAQEAIQLEWEIFIRKQIILK